MMIKSIYNVKRLFNIYPTQFNISKLMVNRNISYCLSLKPSLIKVISLDVTGTILVHSPVSEMYSKSAINTKLLNPPTASEIKIAFKKAYHNNLKKFPCFGYYDNISGREWWRATVFETLQLTGRIDYTTDELNRFFRTVYQIYGSTEGYEILNDANELISYCNDNQYSLGIITNNTERTIEDVLPMLNLHKKFQWFVCCSDVGYEKPSKHIYDYAYEQALFWIPNLKRNEILHIGDNFATDFCGAKAAGFQALHLDRSKNSKVVPYQNWLEAPDYNGKSAEDIKNCTIYSLLEVKSILSSQ